MRRLPLPWPAYPWPGKLKDRTLYYWDGEDFAPISRYSGSLIKLVPTEWGAPTFEIDGIKMLPTSKLSPFEDARRKVELVAPAGKVILDTCGGLATSPPARWRPVSARSARSRRTPT
jgi:predicted methyltransferase